ncbi:MAG TPA: hypothetical protein VIO37_08390 [Candidatus Dormibacteraeota bacterium]
MIARSTFIALTLPVILLACGTTGTPAPTSPTPVASPAVVSAPCNGGKPKVAAPAGPHGVFVLVPSGSAQMTAAINQYLIPNSAICGANFWVRWNSIDKGPAASARYDWSGVEAEIAPWESLGKVVNLIFIGAAEGASTKQGATPTWVQTQVAMVTCANSQSTPVYWQAGYESNWKEFITQAVSHFAGDSHIGYMRFGLGQGGEDLVAPGADAGACKQLWDAKGYQAEWTPYNLRMLALMGSLQSTKQLMVGLNNFNGKPDLGAAVAAKAAPLGIGFGMQGLASGDVTSVAQHLPCKDADWCNLFTKYAGQVPLEVQTLAASNPAGGPVKPGIPGTAPGSSLSMLTGPLPPLLTTALSVKTQIFELYADDCLIAFDPDWAGYAAYHATYATAILSTAAAVGTAGR